MQVMELQGFSGFSNAMSGEMLEFPDNVSGVVLNLDKSEIGAIILGDFDKIQEGDICQMHR